MNHPQTKHQNVFFEHLSNSWKIIPKCMLLCMLLIACQHDGIDEEVDELSYEAFRTDILAQSSESVQAFFNENLVRHNNPNILESAIPRNERKLVNKAIINLHKQNKEQNFIPYLIEEVGYPIWELAYTDIALDKALLIPFATLDGDHVTGFLFGKASEDYKEFQFHLIERRYIDFDEAAIEQKDEYKIITLMVMDIDLFRNPNANHVKWWHDKRNGIMGEDDGASPRWQFCYQVEVFMYTALLPEEEEKESSSRGYWYTETVCIDVGGGGDSGSSSNFCQLCGGDPNFNDGSTVESGGGSGTGSGSTDSSLTRTEDYNDDGTISLYEAMANRLGLSPSEYDCVTGGGTDFSMLPQLGSLASSISDPCNSERDGYDMVGDAVSRACRNGSATMEEVYDALSDGGDWIVEEPSFQNCSSMSCILDNIMKQSGNLYCNTLDAFYGNPLSNVVLSVSPHRGSEVNFFINKPLTNASTVLPEIDGSKNGENVNIIFNPKLCNDLENNSDFQFEVARTLLHEAIHAKIFLDCWPEGISKEDYKAGFQACAIKHYGSELGTFPDAQHQVMAERFVEQIAKALNAYSGGHGSWEDWEYLAWQGLNQYPPYATDPWFLEHLQKSKERYENNTLPLSHPCPN